MTTHTSGTPYLVRCGTDEIFLGRSLAAPQAATLALEGRAFHPVRGPLGLGFAPTPFATQVEFALHGGPTLHRIEGRAAVEEAERALSPDCTRVDAARFPLLSRWFEAAHGTVAPALRNEPGFGVGPTWIESFQLTAEEFRRALLRSPSATSARELDRLAELEGDLVIELGKVANEVGVGLAAFAAGESELARYLDGLGDATALAPGVGGSGSFLSARLRHAKVWARERGSTALVRELNATIKDLLSRLGEVALEHEHALDVLISETYASRSANPESQDEVTPTSRPGTAREPARPAASKARSST